MELKPPSPEPGSLSVAIGPFSETGGVRTHVLALARRSRHQIALIAYSPWSPYYPRYHGLGSALHRHPLLSHWDLYGEFYRKVILARYDVVHTHGHPFWPAPYRAGPRPKHVHTVHQLYDPDDATSERHWRLLARLNAEMIQTCRTADRVIAVSSALADHLLDRYAVDAVVVPSGIELETGPSPASELPAGLRPDGYYLFVGHLGRVKRADLFVRLARRIPDRHFVMVGPGLTGDEVLKHAGSMPPNLVALGPQENSVVRWLMRNARVFVLPSAREAAPIALLEAAAEGTRVVASRLPAVHEFLPPGFPTFRTDDLDDLVTATQEAWESSPPDPSFVGFVRENHDARRIAAVLDGLYREVTEEGE